jgi:cytochrome P450 family 2 subfamily J
MAAREDSSVGYHTIGMTMVSLYMGGTDTISTTTRWVLLNLALRQDVQKKCYDEISGVVDVNGKLVLDQCHYFNAVLMENRRMYPVADTLPHIASQNVTIRGNKFKKGTVFMGKSTKILIILIFIFHKIF